MPEIEIRKVTYTHEDPSRGYLRVQRSETTYLYLPEKVAQRNGSLQGWSTPIGEVILDLSKVNRGEEGQQLGIMTPLLDDETVIYIPVSHKNGKGRLKIDEDTGVDVYTQDAYYPRVSYSANMTRMEDWGIGLRKPWVWDEY